MFELPAFPDILGLKNILITAVASIVIGFGVGYYTSSKFAQADKVNALVEAQRDTAIGISKSIKDSQLIENKSRSSNDSVDSIRAQIALRFKTEKTNETTCNFGSAYIDSGTISLLNSARSGVAVSPASIIDGKSPTASAISGSDLIDNDLQVVKLYRDLAIRHDSLVDYIDEQLTKQAAK